MSPATTEGDLQSLRYRTRARHDQRERKETEKNNRGAWRAERRGVSQLTSSDRIPLPAARNIETASAIELCSCRKLGCADPSIRWIESPARAFTRCADAGGAGW